MKRWIVLCIGIAMYCTGAYAADVYRWVDENGRTQVSDTVPAKYKDTAEKIEARRYDYSDRRTTPPDAATEYRKRTGVSDSSRDSSTGSSASSPKTSSEGSSGTSSAAGQNANARSGSEEETDCDTLHRRFKESADCWGKYTLVGGAKRGAEALAKCGPPVKNPNSKCGFPKKN